MDSLFPILFNGWYSVAIIIFWYSNYPWFGHRNPLKLASVSFWHACPCSVSSSLLSGKARCSTYLVLSLFQHRNQLFLHGALLFFFKWKMVFTSEYLGVRWAHRHCCVIAPRQSCIYFYIYLYILRVIYPHRYIQFQSISTQGSF